MQSIIGGGDSHHSNIADLGEKLDPTSYMTKAVFGDNTFMNPHKFLKPIASKSNEYLSTVTKPVNQFMTSITPGKAYLDNNIPILKQWNQTVENRPVDAAAVAAATYFGGGALAGMGGAEGAGLAASGAPAASTSGGLAGLGAGGAEAGIGAAAGNAITPAFASGLGSSLGGASSGLGTLGAAGTAAGTSMLTPALASLGTAGAAGAATEGMTTMDYIKNAKRIADLLQNGNGNNSNNQSSYVPAPYTSYHNY